MEPGTKARRRSDGSSPVFAGHDPPAEGAGHRRRAGQAAADLMAQHLRVIKGSRQPGTKTGGAVDVVDFFKRT